MGHLLSPPQLLQVVALLIKAWQGLRKPEKIQTHPSCSLHDLSLGYTASHSHQLMPHGWKLRISLIRTAFRQIARYYLAHFISCAPLLLRVLFRIPRLRPSSPLPLLHPLHDPHLLRFVRGSKVEAGGQLLRNSYLGATLRGYFYYCCYSWHQQIVLRLQEWHCLTLRLHYEPEKACPYLKQKGS